MMSAPDPVTLFIGRLASFGPLSVRDRKMLEDLPIKSRSIDAGDLVVRDGDATDDCAVITGGFAIGYKTTSMGNRQIVGLSIPGETSGLHSLFLTVADVSVQALVRSTFAILPRAAFRCLSMTNAAIGHATAVSISAESAIARAWLVNIGRKDARANMAHFLCELMVRLERQGLADRSRFELLLTQDQMGDALGMTAVHINRTLQGLRAAGLIEKDGRFIDIKRWGDLCDIGGFTHRHLSSFHEAEFPIPMVTSTT